MHLFTRLPLAPFLRRGQILLSVTFTPTDTINYTTVSKTVQISVTQAAATITWANPASIVYGTALSATQLNATASVPGTLVYTPRRKYSRGRHRYPLGDFHSDRYRELLDSDKDRPDHRHSGRRLYYLV